MFTRSTLPTKKLDMTTRNAPSKSTMSVAHKKALANGRNEGRIIREYLEIVEATKPRRGRRRTPESIAKRLSVITHELKTADPVTKVRLIQERLNLKTELASMKTKTEMASPTTEYATSTDLCTTSPRLATLAQRGRRAAALARGRMHCRVEQA